MTGFFPVGISLLFVTTGERSFVGVTQFRKWPGVGCIFRPFRPNADFVFQPRQQDFFGLLFLLVADLLTDFNLSFFKRDRSRCFTFENFDDLQPVVSSMMVLSLLSGIENTTSSTLVLFSEPCRTQS